MLYALLNGGAAYLDIEEDGEALDEEIARYYTVSKLQEKIAKCEMVKHEFLDVAYKVQRTTYNDGTQVTIDLEKGSYNIKW